MKVWVGVREDQWAPMAVATRARVLEIMADDIDWATQEGQSEEDWHPSDDHYMVDEGWDFKLIEIEGT